MVIVRLTKYLELFIRLGIKSIVLSLKLSPSNKLINFHY